MSPEDHADLDFESLLESFIGTKIEGIDVNTVDEVITLVLDDNSLMIIGGDDLYVKRADPERLN